MQHTLSTLFPLHLLSNSRVPWPWLRFPPSRRLFKFIFSSPPSTSAPPLCNSALHSFLLPPLSSLSSSRRPWTLNTRQFPCLLLPSTLATISFSAKHPQSLFSPRRHPYFHRPSATRLFTRPSTYELDRPSYCLLRQASNSIDPVSLFETSSLPPLTPPCLIFGGGHPHCH